MRCIWWCIYVNNNALQQQLTDRLLKIQLFFDFFFEKFINQINNFLWRKLWFPGRKYSYTNLQPRETYKIRITCLCCSKNSSDYIGNIETYAAEGEKWDVYQENYYSSVTTVEHLLSRQVQVRGTIRANRDPPDSNIWNVVPHLGKRVKFFFNSSCCQHDSHNSYFNDSICSKEK